MEGKMVANVLEVARRSKGVSQTRLASLSNGYQSNISQIENGETDPGITTVNRYLKAIDFSLVPLPTRTPIVAEFALKIASALEEGSQETAFRIFLELNDRLKEAKREICLVLSITPAPFVGDEKFDALIAGLVEYHLRKRRLPVVDWVKDSKRSLKSKWLVDSYAPSQERVEKRTPKSFLKRNILLSESELVSI